MTLLLNPIKRLIQRSREDGDSMISLVLIAVIVIIAAVTIIQSGVFRKADDSVIMAASQNFITMLTPVALERDAEGLLQVNSTYDAALQGVADSAAKTLADFNGTWTVCAGLKQVTNNSGACNIVDAPATQRFGRDSTGATGALGVCNPWPDAPAADNQVQNSFGGAGGCGAGISYVGVAQIVTRRPTASTDEIGTTSFTPVANTQVAVTAPGVSSSSSTSSSTAGGSASSTPPASSSAYASSSSAAPSSSSAASSSAPSSSSASSSGGYSISSDIDASSKPTSHSSSLMPASSSVAASFAGGETPFDGEEGHGHGDTEGDIDGSAF